MHCLNNLAAGGLLLVLSQYRLQLASVNPNEKIPYSFWGTPEAGRLGSTLFARSDTPVHSILHEAAHYICMPAARRKSSEIDANGSAIEESACCYLQILLSDYIGGINRNILMQDMDQWGYSFRLGSAQHWFYADSEDAQQWLINQQVLTLSRHPTWQLR